MKRCDGKRDDITYMSVVDGVIESCRAELGKKSETRREKGYKKQEGARGGAQGCQSFHMSCQSRGFHVSEKEMG